MRKKPRNFNQFLKYVIGRCEGCGSRLIEVTELGEVERAGLGTRLAASIGSGIDQRRLESPRAQGGLTIDYYCRNCDGDFERFYTVDAIEAYLRSIGTED